MVTETAIGSDPPLLALSSSPAQGQIRFHGTPAQCEFTAPDLGFATVTVAHAEAEWSDPSTFDLANPGARLLPPRQDRGGAEPGAQVVVWVPSAGLASDPDGLWTTDTHLSPRGASVTAFTPPMEVEAPAGTFGEYAEEAAAAFATLALPSEPGDRWHEAVELLCALCLEGHQEAVLTRIAALMGMWSAQARIVMLDGLMDFHITSPHHGLKAELESMFVSPHRRSFTAAMMALNRCVGVSAESLLARRQALPEDHRSILDVYVRRVAVGPEGK